MSDGELSDYSKAPPGEPCTAIEFTDEYWHCMIFDKNYRADKGQTRCPYCLGRMKEINNYNNYNRLMHENYAKVHKKTRITLPQEGKSVGEFAAGLSKFYHDENKLFYRLVEEEVVKIDAQEVGGNESKKVLIFQQVKASAFITLVENDFEVGIERHVGQDTFFKPKSMPESVAKAVLDSEYQFKANLPVIERIFNVPMPFLKEGKLVFPQKGYDPKLKSWLPEDSPDINENMTLEEAKKIIGKINKEFCYTTEQDRTNAIAAQMTPFCRGLYKRETCRTPIVFYKANRERAGKDYCAGVPGLVFEGEAIEDPAIVSENEVHDDEFRKKILATLKSGRGRIHSSNNKGFLNSATLEGFSTSENWEDRQLGVNLMLKFPNTIELSLSANTGITYTPDLAARCIFVNLFFSAEDPNQRRFEEPNLHEWIKENRGDLVSAYFTLIRNWVEKEMPAGSQPFTSFPEWARVVGGIMESAGYGSPCVPNDTSDAVGGDSETREMKKLFEAACEKWGEQWVGKKQIFTEFMNQDSNFAGLFGWLKWDIEPERARMRFGRILDKFKGRELSGITLNVKEETHSNRNQYQWTWTKGKSDKKEGEQVVSAPLVPSEPFPNPPRGEKKIEGSIPEVPKAPKATNQQVLDAFKQSPSGLQLGADFKFAPEDWRPMLKAMAQDGIIYMFKPDNWKLLHPSGDAEVT